MSGIILRGEPKDLGDAAMKSAQDKMPDRLPKTARFTFLQFQDSEGKIQVIILIHLDDFDPVEAVEEEGDDDDGREKSPLVRQDEEYVDAVALYAAHMHRRDIETLTGQEAEEALRMANDYLEHVTAPDAYEAPEMFVMRDDHSDHHPAQSDEIKEEVLQEMAEETAEEFGEAAAAPSDSAYIYLDDRQQDDHILTQLDDRVINTTSISDMVSGEQVQWRDNVLQPAEPAADIPAPMPAGGLPEGENPNPSA